MVVRLMMLAVCLVACCDSVADEISEALVKATYKLVGDGSAAGGTAYRISDAAGVPRYIIVTAHHVLDRMKGNSCLIVARSLRGDRNYQRLEIRVPIRNGGQTLWKKHAVHDLAVLPLGNVANLEALPLDSLATEESLGDVRVGDQVRVGVFPEKAESNPAGFCILRSGSLASFPITPVRSHPGLIIDTTHLDG